jgi:abequosyltransferase
MNPIRLSICMPTYNFGRFIGEALDSIMTQATEEVEVVVLDGASTDNTADVVRSFQARSPRLYYHRLDSRGGIDRDMARSVELAHGDYCWLFSSDDVMRENALKDILEEITLGFDLYLCGLTLCTLDMQPISQHRILSLESDAEFDLANGRDRLRYFELAETTTAFFSFMGSLIVKKTKWAAIPFNEAFDGSLWAHVARIFEMIPQGLRLKYLARPYLCKRSDNDSFMDKGLGHRYKVAIDGYDRLADAFFDKDSIEAFHIRRTVRNEVPWIRALLNFKLAKIKRVPKDDLLLLDQLAAAVYRERSLLKRAPFLIYKMTPLPVARVARAVYKALKPWLRAPKFR